MGVVRGWLASQADSSPPPAAQGRQDPDPCASGSPHSPSAAAGEARLSERRRLIRLVGALMLETNDEWTVARRYMSLETLARVTDNPTVRLPAMAT